MRECERACGSDTVTLTTRQRKIRFHNVATSFRPEVRAIFVNLLIGQQTLCMGIASKESVSQPASQAASQPASQRSSTSDQISQPVKPAMLEH
jgi:hypothetical protein